jgi:hypothetical protein
MTNLFNTLLIAILPFCSITKYPHRNNTLDHIQVCIISLCCYLFCYNKNSSGFSNTNIHKVNVGSITISDVSWITLLPLNLPRSLSISIYSFYFPLILLISRCLSVSLISSQFLLILFILSCFFSLSLASFHFPLLLFTFPSSHFSLLFTYLCFIKVLKVSLFPKFH